MIDRTALLLGLAAVGLGCTRPGETVPSDLPRTVAVLEPSNHTGDPLLVAGTSFLERYALRTERVTVPDVLASEARLQLERRGFTAVPPETVEGATEGRAPGSTDSAVAIARHGGLVGLVLWIDVRRWEPDAPTLPTFVIVGLTAELIDSTSGLVRWRAERRPAPVATPGEVNLGDAYLNAARKVMAELLAPLGPER
ncbi:MAG: hypothetical protein E6J71_05320 [Deltaproteobacteria bacterium]|nr:MAG: hypothetical protein E6J81_00970 [Deltaproteobacteria bacterium]TMA51984.1 MAG: hypothetical protein E6J76_08575 [Deltaproteobacteria bacterium]TMA84165.1 MAG: hypothetical protein E6J77_13095 [Deltaproteobacteria bacterium]TMB22757.1 MAG: hypothetical protein E6J71_05320 [Deltaproteobacteria bacterium]